MLGLSMTELVIILALALLLLGPDQLPSMAKALGKGLRELRKATDDLKSTFEQEMVKMEDATSSPRMIAPAPPPPASSDPGEARAAARAAAADPGEARAAARRAAQEPPKLAAPEGTVQKS
jgi:TatA/E family protein of Tat protein translocase